MHVGGARQLLRLRQWRGRLRIVICTVILMLLYLIQVQHLCEKRDLFSGDRTMMHNTRLGRRSRQGLPARAYTSTQDFAEARYYGDLLPATASAPKGTNKLQHNLVGGVMLLQDKKHRVYKMHLISWDYNRRRSVFCIICQCATASTMPSHFIYGRNPWVPHASLTKISGKTPINPWYTSVLVLGTEIDGAGPR